MQKNICFKFFKMELGECETVISLGKKGRGGYSKKDKPNRGITRKNNEEIYCNACKKNTSNMKDISYNYNSNVGRWSASAVCSSCNNNKSIFVKN